MKNDSRTIASVNAAGEIFAHYGGEAVAREVIGAGGDLAEFHRRLAPAIRAERDLDRAAGFNLTERDVREFSISRLVRSLMSQRLAFGRELPDQFDRNNDDARMIALAERNASCPEFEMTGSRIPWSVLTRDFSSAQAGAVIPTRLGTEHTGDALRAAMPLAALGALMPVMSGTGFKVPVIATDVSNVGFLGEVAGATEGAPTTGLVDFATKRGSAYVEVSKQAIIQGGAPLDSVLERVIFGKTRATIEDAAINGDGTGDNPLGVRATPNVNTVVGGTDGATLAWAHLTDLEYEPAADNVLDNFTGYLVNPATRRFLKRTVRASGLPFMWENGPTPLNGHRAAASTLLPSNLVKGGSGAVCSSVVYSADWSMLMIPIFGLVDITVDPFSKADQGIVRLICNVYMSAGVLQPPAFAVMDDAKLS
jgi:HK97 family phage major capsid protein